MGRKTKSQKNYKAIIVFAGNSKEVIELDKNERIKNLNDLSRLPNLKKIYNRKKAKYAKANKKAKNTINVSDDSILETTSFFCEQSFLNDFTIDGKSLQDFDFKLDETGFLCL